MTGMPAPGPQVNSASLSQQCLLVVHRRWELFFFFLLFRVAGVAYGGSQARPPT